eukprot:1002953-Prorocentrum_minimum.AAC.2
MKSDPKGDPQKAGRAWLLRPMRAKAAEMEAASPRTLGRSPSAGVCAGATSVRPMRTAMAGPPAACTATAPACPPRHVHIGVIPSVSFHLCDSIGVIPFVRFHRRHSIGVIPLVSFHRRHSIRAIPSVSFHRRHSIGAIPSVSFHNNLCKVALVEVGVGEARVEFDDELQVANDAGHARLLIAVQHRVEAGRAVGATLAGGSVETRSCKFADTSGG